jgi:hypothetical protein
LGSALFAFAHAQTAGEDHNTPPAEVRGNIAAGSAQPTGGVVFFTTAINSDGTVVQAINGWSRWVSPDTLTFGTENVWCNTADRAGDSNAVWVNCQTSGGPSSQRELKAADASFFLFVAR